VRLCHARTSTTVNVYAHPMPGADRDAVHLLAELLAPAPERVFPPGETIRASV
jgi:hypothetical protein